MKKNSNNNAVEVKNSNLAAPVNENVDVNFHKLSDIELMMAFRSTSKVTPQSDDDQTVKTIIRTKFLNMEELDSFIDYLASHYRGWSEALAYEDVAYRLLFMPCHDLTEQALLRAVNAGSKTSLIRLGLFYATTKARHYNLKKSFKYFLEAAELGSVPCMYRVAESYLKGKGVKQNWDEGKKWLDKANKLNPNKDGKWKINLETTLE